MYFLPRFIYRFNAPLDENPNRLLLLCLFACVGILQKLYKNLFGKKIYLEKQRDKNSTDINEEEYKNKTERGFPGGTVVKNMLTM